MSGDDLELTLSEERQILDAAPDAMVVVRSDGTISFANRQTVKVFGYPLEELLGRPLDLLIPERFRSSHGGHVARFLSAPIARPMGSGLELFGRKRDGSEIHIEVSLSPVRTERGMMVSAAIRDISERKKIEQRAKLASERLASALESTQDAFALFDASDRLVECNRAYRELVGAHLEGDLIGRRYEEILEGFLAELDFAPAQREAFRRERLATRREAQTTFDVKTRDGRSLRVVDHQTPEGGIVKTVWDLTDDVRRAEELEKAQIAAEAGSAAKSEFLSSMSHELRTPLNAILGFAQLLELDRKEPLSARQKERAAQIIKGGEHLLRLIDDILDLSRIEAGRVAISTEPVDVDIVLGEIEITLAALAAKNDVSIELERDEGVPRVLADRTRLSQILMNFGSNAIKYNRPGGRVTFVLKRPTRDRLRIEVRDTGLGIPADQQSKLFQPFQRAGQETGPIEGTGIGLVITERLARLMGGTVGFTSTFGEGSSFWVDLPLAKEAAPRTPNEEVETSVTPTSTREGIRTVLYVEDNPANVAFMKDFIEDIGSIELFVSPTGEMGVELARQLRPSLVILDINLPGQSGFEALAALKSDARTMAVPVIALTAAASPREAERGLAAGFARYLTKPIKVGELAAALDALLPR